MFKDLVMKNRSCRGYDETKTVSEEEVKTLISYTRYCPQARNLQALKYLIVTDEKTVKFLQENTMFGGALAHLHLPFENEKPKTFIVVFEDLSISDSPLYNAIDLGIAAQTILLGAAEMGISGIMIKAFKKDVVKKGLALAEHLDPTLIIPLGYSVEKTKIVDYESGSIAYYRDEENVHYIPKRKLEDIIL